MTSDDIMSEVALLGALRRRQPIFAVPPTQVSTPIEEIDREFRIARHKRSDVGVWNHALNFVLEPRNPFEPGRARRPKVEATVFGTLSALIVVAVLAFNLAAQRP